MQVAIRALSLNKQIRSAAFLNDYEVFALRAPGIFYRSTFSSREYLIMIAWSVNCGSKVPNPRSRS